VEQTTVAVLAQELVSVNGFSDTVQVIQGDIAMPGSDWQEHDEQSVWEEIDD
jgi:hypothetical protein